MTPLSRHTDAALFDAPTAVEKSALLSDCGRYRYSLGRHWDAAQPAVLFVMLNPSTADAKRDDQTITKCMGFARRWNYGGIVVVNLYAWRATNPADLPASTEAVSDPADPFANDRAIYAALDGCQRVIAAWGANVGPVLQRPGAVLRQILYGRLEALRLTKHGQPWHPLYVPYAVEPVRFWGSS